MTTGTASPHITIVGGVYRERCMRPQWREIYGSAGRAASAIAAMGGPVRLNAYLDPLSQEVIAARAALEGFALAPTAADSTLTFEYDHGLATPRIYGSLEQRPALTLRANRILRFGMLDGDAVVHGDRVVYDPQNAASPRPFRENGSTARVLALVLNRHEAALSTGLSDASAAEMAQALIRDKRAQVVVIKQGPQGAVVHDGSAMQRVPAYETTSVWKIGSGDNFAAHFAFRWLTEGKTPTESADLASRATAYYCQNRGFATPSALTAFLPKAIVPSAAYQGGKRPRVYLAGPFFTLAQVWQVEQARRDLITMGLDVFSPYHDVGHGSAADVVGPDLAGIESSDVLFAIADGMDSGTVYEIGYARAKSKPVIMYCENESSERKKMMQGSDCILCEDYVTAVYRTLWTASRL